MTSTQTAEAIYSAIDSIAVERATVYANELGNCFITWSPDFEWMIGQIADLAQDDNDDALASAWQWIARRGVFPSWVDGHWCLHVDYNDELYNPLRGWLPRATGCYLLDRLRNVDGARWLNASSASVLLSAIARVLASKPEMMVDDASS